VFNAYELLHIAKQEARRWPNRLPPATAGARIQVAGDVGIATFKMMLVNMLEGRFISPYDYEIAVPHRHRAVRRRDRPRHRWSTRTGCSSSSASTSSNWPSRKRPRPASPTC
jgi:hypothetical protein